VSDRTGTISIHAERLPIPDATSQFEIVVKSLARVNTQLNVQGSFKLLLAVKVKNTW